MKTRGKAPTHTASLSTIVRRALGHECALPRGSTVVVAVSGGPDSMALLSAMTQAGPRADLAVVAHGVDHGLRPEAAAELDLAEAFARKVHVPFDRSQISVSRGGNLQERARDLRWNALAAVARKYGAVLAAAHHADDRAETLLLRMLRGAGLRGLAVLPPRTTVPRADDVTLVRPILRARRSDVVTHLERHGVPFAIDPSNTDPRYLRTRVRERVLPLLEELDPSIVRHLEAIADDLVSMTAPPASNGEDRQGLGHTNLPAWAKALPRPTQEALATLVLTRSSDARVWLPGDLVASVNPHAPRRARPPNRTRGGTPTKPPTKRVDET